MKLSNMERGGGIWIFCFHGGKYSPYAPHIPFLHESHLRLSSSALDPVRVCMPCPQLDIV